jgi:uncharacterized membrane protein YraQ (UPF0718 family)
MIILYVVTAVALGASLVASPHKTAQALKRAGKRFAKILPAFLGMLVLFSVVITLLPEDVVKALLGGEHKWLSVTVASVTGSLTLMPGFIAFPLCGVLLKEGVLRMVLSAFSTTLMTVGVLTYPLERQYFGRTVTLVRNGISLVIALIVAVVMGLVFGEICL